MSFLDSADDDPKRAARRPLLFFILVTLIVGAGASLFTDPNIPTWYAGLVHPAFAPPNWLFAPVWTTLYVVMADAAHQIGLALVEIGLLLLLILATTILFWRRDRLAGWLFLPYLAWTAFAAYLNHAFWLLNP